MADRSKIEWTDATWPPIVAIRKDDGKVGFHCEKVSPACSNCYAETFNKRRLPARGTGLPYTRSSRDQVTISIDEPTLLKPLKWRRPRRIFVESTSDLFADFVPFKMVDRVFAVMACCPDHTFQILTKRPDRMAKYFAERRGVMNLHWLLGPGLSTHDEVEEWCRKNGVSRKERERRVSAACYHGDRGIHCTQEWPLKNVWLGTTVENQEWVDKRREHLKACPAAVKFVSYEPALGPVDWTGWEFVNWIISGGESGRNARPAHPDWFRATRDFCRDHSIAYFHKQWGEWCPFGQLPESSLGHPALNDNRLDDKRYCRIDGKYSLHRVGKKAAGRLLDGVEYSEFPHSNLTSPAPVAAE